MFQYDPNRPDLLLADYNAQIGAQYTGRSSNAFVFLDDDRNVVDYYLTDVDSEWVDFTTNPDDGGGFAQVVTRCQRSGVKNILILHNHGQGDGGPCDGLLEFMADAHMTFSASGLALRGCIVTLRGVLDGVVLPLDGVDDTQQRMIDEGREHIAMMREFAADGDATAALIIPMLEEVIASWERGDKANPTTLAALIQMTIGKLAELDSDAQNTSVLDLPRVNVQTTQYLN